MATAPLIATPIPFPSPSPSPSPTRLQLFIERQRFTLTVAVCLFAYVGLRSGLNPPRGISRDGYSILAIQDPSGYICFSILNASVLLKCFVAVLVLLFDLHRRRMEFRAILIYAIAFSMGGTWIEHFLYSLPHSSLTPAHIYAYAAFVLVLVAPIVAYGERQLIAEARKLVN